MHEFNLIIWLGHTLGLEKYINEETSSIVGSIIVFVIIVIMSLFVRWKLTNPEKHMVPDKKVGLINIAEVFAEAGLDVLRGVLGEKADKFFPLIGSLFIYILLCNLLGFIPGMVAPTTSINTNLSCALIVFLYYNYIGIKERGFFGYFKHFLGPVIWIAPLFFFVELVSHLVRPITLSIRLYGNMTGDHIVLGIFTGLAPVLVPIFFIVLGVFVAFVQAFVFAILSTVYIALAIEE